MKVFLDMVGCRLNQSELENYARQFRNAGHSLTADASSADLVVINTCSVTAAAASDSRQKIRQTASLGAGQIVVTGCWVTLNMREAAEFPKVRQVIANAGKDDLVSTVLNLPSTAVNHPPTQRQPIPGARLRTRAFIKVQDGCDNYCTYCITRLARGTGRSRRIPEILEDVQSAVNGGTQEIVLTGVHLGSWGYDFSTPDHLTHLVSVILSETDTPRLRLSSLEPWDISSEFFQLWQNSRLCRHLHLPLQSGCEATLKRMGRRVTPQSFADLINLARENVPGIAISTDIITGFPGETDLEFTESAAFVESMEFTHGHVFTYSPRPGTPAAQLPGQVSNHIAKERNHKMHKILQTGTTAYLEKHIGLTLGVLWEKAIPIDTGKWELHGLSDNYLRVRLLSSTPCYNQQMDVKILEIKNGELLGEICSSGFQAPRFQDTL